MRSVWFLLTLSGISYGIPHSPFPYFPHAYQAPYTPNFGHFQPTPMSRSPILSPQYGYIYPAGLSRSGVPSPQYGHLHPIDSYRSSMPSHIAFANTVENLQHTTNQASSVQARTNIPLTSVNRPSQLSVTYPTLPSSHSFPIKFPRIHWFNNIPVYDPTLHIGSLKLSRTSPPGEGQIPVLDQSVANSAWDNLQSRTNIPLTSVNRPSQLSVTYPTLPSSHSFPIKFPRIHWFNKIPVYDPTLHIGSLKLSRTSPPGEGQIPVLDHSVANTAWDSLQSRTVEDLQDERIDQELMSHQQSVARSFFYVPPKTTRRAVVHLVEADGSGVTGNLEVFQVVAPFGVSLGVKIVGSIKGLKAGKHGFHVHEGSATTNNCIDAGDHFNPENTQHGPHSILDQSFSYDWFGQRHAGDLGNVVTEDDGIDTTVRKYDKYLKLGDGSTKDINNLVIVVHLNEDTGSQDNNGNAGTRVACGIIKLIQ